MPLFDNLEKLLTEHGSAAILRERLGLASDKYSALENEAKALRAEVAHLTKENNELRDINQSLLPSPNLDENEEIMLKQFAEANHFVQERVVAQKLGFSAVRTKHHVDSLIDKVFLTTPRVITSDVPPSYCITQVGRAYALRKGLVD